MTDLTQRTNEQPYMTLAAFRRLPELAKMLPASDHCSETGEHHRWCTRHRSPGSWLDFVAVHLPTEPPTLTMMTLLLNCAGAKALEAYAQARCETPIPDDLPADADFATQDAYFQALRARQREVIAIVNTLTCRAFEATFPKEA